MRRWLPQPWREPQAALGLLFAAAVGPISSTLLLGQTGLLSLAAVLGLCSLPARFRALRIACVVVASTKPTLTLPVLCFLALTEPALVAIAAAVAVVLCTPVWLASGGVGVVGEWLSALKLYATIPSNAPIDLSSAHHLLARFAPSVPAALLTVAAMVGGLLLGYRARVRATGLTLENLLLLLALSAAFLPLHEYDMVCVVPLAAMIPFARRSAAWFPLGVLMTARPGLIARALGAAGLQMDHANTFVSGSGAVLLVFGLCYLLISQRELFAEAPDMSLLRASDKAA
jgi:hypothetical protein